MHCTVLKIRWKATEHWLKKTYNDFSYLDNGVKSKLPKDTTDMTGEEVKKFFKESVEFLKKRVKYCFTATAAPLTWKISTWSRQICASEIKNHGSKSDRLFLKNKETYWNKPQKSSGGCKAMMYVKHPKRQQWRLKKMISF